MLAEDLRLKRLHFSSKNSVRMFGFHKGIRSGLSMGLKSHIGNLSKIKEIFKLFNVQKLKATNL